MATLTTAWQSRQLPSLRQSMQIPVHHSLHHSQMPSTHYKVKYQLKSPLCAVFFLKPGLFFSRTSTTWLVWTSGFATSALTLMDTSSQKGYILTYKKTSNGGPPSDIYIWKSSLLKVFITTISLNGRSLIWLLKTENRTVICFQFLCDTWSCVPDSISFKWPWLTHSNVV